MSKLQEIMKTYGNVNYERYTAVNVMTLLGDK